MDDLQRTELVIAKILAHLMQRGIQRDLVDFSEVIGDEDLEPFIAPCFYWLEAEGVVRARSYAETKESFAVGSPALTSRGFQLMGVQIALGGEEQTLGSAVRQVSEGSRSFPKLAISSEDCLVGLPSRWVPR